MTQTPQPVAKALPPANAAPAPPTDIRERLFCERIAQGEAMVEAYEAVFGGGGEAIELAASEWCPAALERNATWIEYLRDGCINGVVSRPWIVTQLVMLHNRLLAIAKEETGSVAIRAVANSRSVLETIANMDQEARTTGRRGAPPVVVVNWGGGVAGEADVVDADEDDTDSDADTSNAEPVSGPADPPEPPPEAAGGGA